MTRPVHRFRWTPALVACLAAPFYVTGCGGQTQVTGHNREIIVSLTTAVSARNPQWLDANEKLVESRKSEGALSEGEYREFKEIITKARDGDWPAAEAQVYALRDGQTPTAEDLQNVAQRKLAPEHARPKTPPKNSNSGRRG